MDTSQRVQTNAGASQYSMFERYILARTHPASLFLGSAGLIWEVYFLWSGNWMAALAILISERIVSTLIGWRSNPQAVAETTLGKIAILHLHPVNLVVQLCGLVVSVAGVWLHETQLILGGVSLILVGHVFGWGRVDYRFSLDQGGSSVTVERKFSTTGRV
jgi:hypothetical protein